MRSLIGSFKVSDHVATVPESFVQGTLLRYDSPLGAAAVGLPSCEQVLQPDICSVQTLAESKLLIFDSAQLLEMVKIAFPRDGVADVGCTVQTPRLIMFTEVTRGSLVGSTEKVAAGGMLQVPPTKLILRRISYPVVREKCVI
jgi:hypothetical protein